MNRRSVLFAAVIAVIFMFSASARAEIWFANLQPVQEVPVSGTSATGWARVVLNESAGTIAFTVVFNNLSSNQVASHIHCCAAIGANGPVIINFGVVGGTSGMITGTAAITPAQVTSIRQHLAYVNVHSANFPNGEIRGQLGGKRPVDFDGDGETDLSVVRWTTNNPPAGPMQFYNLNSTSGFQAIGPFGEASTDLPQPGDYDGDGKDDICVFRRTATIGADTYFYLIKSSDGTFQAVRWGVVGPVLDGTVTDIPIPRDYDGDGRTDMAVFRPGAAAGQRAYWYYRSTRNGFAQVSIPWGTTGDGSFTFDIPVPGDYDGDGKCDVAVYRFGMVPTNNFIVLKSSDGTAQFAQWGNFQTDWIVPGDYDGDGKCDFAIARRMAAPTDPLIWWIRRSSDGATFVKNWGLSGTNGDVPVQGDYDGDARTDIAIYRRGASTGLQSYFWVVNSLSGNGTATPFGLGSVDQGTPPYPNYFRDYPLADFDTR